MILVDTNLLVYASVANDSRHEAARTWLEAQFNGGHRVGLPWPSLLGFVRLVSNPRIFGHPLPVPAAWQRVEEWLELPNVWIPRPEDRHREILREIIPLTAGRPNLVPDAHVAALAIEHGLTLCSADGDFARFPKLRWTNPLTPPP